jgi:glycosyltransferase involved in cell wall biosynthesis
MVIVPDYLSVFLNKGEEIDRYYNPGDVFDEVHIVLTNDDRPNMAAVKRMAGRARVHLYKLPTGNGLFVRTLGWRPWLLERWVKQAVDLAGEIQPNLIRCHGALLNGYAAYRIKQAYGVPYLVSLHINPDEDVRGRASGLKARLFSIAQQTVGNLTLLNADLVMPVYQPIVPYLKRIGAPRYEVCYNVLNPAFLTEKTDYALHDPVRVVSVGRQFKEKNPDNLIHAVSKMPNVELTIVGDGSYHDYLHKVAAECGISNRVIFHKALPNDELCRQLPQFDIFAVHTEYWELSKSVLEPLLTGLPIVINRRIGAAVPELTEDICLLVENTVDGYMDALTRLIGDDDYRAKLGRQAYAHARANWSPAATESRFAEIYRSMSKPFSANSLADGVAG